MNKKYKIIGISCVSLLSIVLLCFAAYCCIPKTTISLIELGFALQKCDRIIVHKSREKNKPYNIRYTIDVENMKTRDYIAFENKLVLIVIDKLRNRKHEIPNH